MAKSENPGHVVVHLHDLESGKISQYPTTLGENEPIEVAAERVKSEQTEAQNKHFLVDDIIVSPERGRHKKES